MRLSAALFMYGEAGAPSEVPTWAARAAATAPEDPLLPVVLAAAAGTRFSGDLARATAHARRALSAVPENDPARRYPLFALADIALFEGRLTDAVRLFTTQSDLAKAAGDTYFAAYAVATSSLSHTYQGDIRTALQLAEQAKQLGTAIVNPTTLAWADYALAEALLDDHQLDRARAALDRALAHARTARNRMVIGVTLTSNGSLNTRHGDPARAAALLGEAIDHWSQTGDWTLQWITIRHVIDLLVRLGAHEPAAMLYGALTDSATATTAYGPDAARLRSHAEHPQRRARRAAVLRRRRTRRRIKRRRGHPIRSRRARPRTHRRCPGELLTMYAVRAGAQDPRNAHGSPAYPRGPQVEKLPQLQRHVKREPVVGVLEICVDELERLGEVATERVAVHVAGMGRIVTPREVEGQLEHVCQVGSVLEVVPQEPAQAPVKEILGTAPVESVAQQAIERERPRGADEHPTGLVRQVAREPPEPAHS